MKIKPTTLPLSLIFTFFVCSFIRGAENPYKTFILEQKVVAKDPGRYIGWPSIAKLSDGRLMAVYSGDRDWHVCPWGKIRMVYSDDNGVTWSAPQTIFDTPLDERGAGICVTAEGTALIGTYGSIEFAKTNSPFYDERYYVYADYAASLDSATRAYWKKGWVCRSEDGGMTWGDPIAVPNTNSAPLRAQHGPIQLKDGRLLIVCGNGVTESSDDGRTWTKIAEFPVEQYPNMSESCAVELEDNNILVLMRATPTMTQYDSQDGGTNWCSAPFESTGIYGYPPHVIKLENDWLVVVYGRRTFPCGIYSCVSTNGGITWDTTNEITLATIEKFRGTVEELGYSPVIDMGYPCSALLDDGSIWTVYYASHRDGEWPCLMGVHWRLDARITETSGGDDPENKGFAFNGSGTYDTGSGYDGEDYWYTQSTRNAAYYYTAQAEDFNHAGGWTATYRTKVMPTTNTLNFTDNFFCPRNGSRRFDMSVFGGSGTNAAGVYVLLSSGYIRIDTNVSISVTNYHTYQVYYDPDTASALYYVDGTLMASFPETALYTTALRELRWGDQNSTPGGLCENRYSLVSLESGPHIHTLAVQTGGGGNPVNAGFSFNGSGTYMTGTGYDSEDYWYTQSTCSAAYCYTAKTSDFQNAWGWTATYRTKVMPTTNTLKFTDNFFCPRNGSRRFDMSVFGGSETNEAGVYVLLSSGYVRIDTNVSISVTNYHTYQVYYDPDTASASYYVDGALMATFPETALYTTVLRELRWGDQNSTPGGSCENRYSLVSLEKGRKIVAEDRLIIQFTAVAHPEDKGFTFSSSGTYNTGNGYDGEDYWYTQSTCSAAYYYTAKTGDFKHPDGWTATYRTKVMPTTNTLNFTDNFFCPRNGSRRFDMSVFGGSGTNAAGVYALLSSGYVRIDTNVSISVTNYHTYQVCYNPDTASASYYADGTLMATFPETSFYTTALRELRWGDQNSTPGGLCENRYSLVSLEKGQK